MPLPPALLASSKQGMRPPLQRVAPRSRPPVDASSAELQEPRGVHCTRGKTTAKMEDSDLDTELLAEERKVLNELRREQALLHSDDASTRQRKRRAVCAPVRHDAACEGCPDCLNPQWKQPCRIRRVETMTAEALHVRES